MFDRKYFDEVLSDQLRLLGRPGRFTLHLANGDEYMVRSLIAAHDSYVILEVHSDGKPAQRGKRWQAEHPDADPTVFDQISIPYSYIAFGYLTARATKGDDDRRVVGFRQE
jgi:hypothetical protein